MRSLNGKYGILFVSFLLVFSTCLTATAHESHFDAPHALAEIEEHAGELVELSDTLHVDSARIADDESLDEDLRATAESFHLKTHDMKHIGEHILSHVETLEGLYSDPETNADEINSEIAAIESELDELEEIANSNADAVHTIESDTPDSHQEYAESLHENFHEIQHIGSHLVKYTDELGGEESQADHDSSNALMEIEEHADELVDLSDTLHVDSAQIADDESLDEDLRATAESFHLKTHDMKHIGEHILSHVETLEGLYSDPETNADEINSEIAAIESEIDELKEIVNSNADAVHSIESNTPASHQEYAEALHENFHEVGHIGSHLVKYTDELEESMATEDTTISGDAANEEQSEQESSATANQTPGFGILMAACGLLAVGYLKRQ
jgi:chromosome segregation ATPase